MKIRWFPADFPTDFSFKGAKTKKFEHTGINMQQKKIQGLKQKNHELTETKMIIKHYKYMSILYKDFFFYCVFYAKFYH
jgi:hypothetical protein